MEELSLCIYCKGRDNQLPSIWNIILRSSCMWWLQALGYWTQALILCITLIVNIQTMNPPYSLYPLSNTPRRLSSSWPLVVKSHQQMQVHPVSKHQTSSPVTEQMQVSPRCKGRGSAQWYSLKNNQSILKILDTRIFRDPNYGQNSSFSVCKIGRRSPLHPKYPWLTQFSCHNYRLTPDVVKLFSPLGIPHNATLLEYLDDSGESYEQQMVIVPHVHVIWALEMEYWHDMKSSWCWRGKLVYRPLCLHDRSWMKIHSGTVSLP